MKNQTKRKIYVVGGDIDYANWMECEIVSRLHEATAVVFTGGEDVSPSFYGAARHPATYANLNRDLREKLIFHECRKLKLPMIGICRGAQFLCVMNGGKLIQHQQNPKFLHPIQTYDDKTIIVSSCHHQAQLPWNLPADEFKVLGWSSGISEFHEDGNRQEVANNLELETVFYKKYNCIGFQGHPEMIYRHDSPELQRTIEWHRDLLNKFLDNQITAQ